LAAIGLGFTMSELRYDPLGGFWVNVASVRAERPDEFVHIESRRSDAVCPFCRGREEETPPAILELGSAESVGSVGTASQGNAAGDGWLVRVVPNKYPAFAPGDSSPALAIGPYLRIAGGGAHEIVVESPRHVVSTSQLTDAELLWSLRACQMRVAAAHQADGIRQVTVFKNCRPEAGASIEHAHCQIVASPQLSTAGLARWERCVAARRANGRSILASIIEFELKQRARVVDSRGKFVAFCPFASRFACQVWIGAAARGTCFEELAESDLADVGWLIRSIATRLERRFESPPYNWVLHLPPRDSMGNGDDPQEIFPWFIEFIPRLSRWAGFELAEGGWINDWPPDLAARQLRGE
jgi:UDPglucose--hexose-1-phosphate uridylyltransferase